MPRLPKVGKPYRVSHFADWPGHPGWRLLFDFVEADGELVCHGVGIRSLEDQPVTARAIREPSWSTLIERARREIFKENADFARLIREQADIANSLGLTFDAAVQRSEDDELEHLERLAAIAEGKHGRRPGPSHLGDEHYQAVARIYAEHLDGGGRTPTKAVADEWAVPHTTANTWVERARKRGWLIGKSRQGVPSGRFRRGPQ